MSCGSVGKAVASNPRGPLFESCHWQSLHWSLFTANCIKKTKIKKNRSGMAHFKKQTCTWDGRRECTIRKWFNELFGWQQNEKVHELGSTFCASQKRETYFTQMCLKNREKERECVCYEERCFMRAGALV